MANFGYQLQKTTGTSVDANDPVLFDTTPILADDDNIIYDSVTGKITFQNPGRYYVSWYVATQTGLGISGVNFSIVDNNTTPNVYTSSNPTKTGQTSGFVLIEATSGLSIQLINTSPGVVSYAEGVSVIAGIGVLKAQLYTSLGGIELQASGASGETLATGATIPFDTTFADYSTGLALSGNGVQITSPGVYSVDWWVALSGSITPNKVNFVLKDQDGNVLATSYSPVVVPGVFYGSTLLNVTAQAAPLTVYLYNDTGDQINLSSIDVQAGIRIIEATSV